MPALYPKLLEAEVVALASPIFFYGLSAQVKAMIDRTQAHWARRYIIKQDLRKRLANPSISSFRKS